MTSPYHVLLDVNILESLYPIFYLVLQNKGHTKFYLPSWHYHNYTYSNWETSTFNMTKIWHGAFIMKPITTSPTNKTTSIQGCSPNILAIGFVIDSNHPKDFQLHLHKNHMQHIFHFHLLSSSELLVLYNHYKFPLEQNQV